MAAKQKTKQQPSIHMEKKQFFIYSMYLAFGSLAFFIALTGAYTTFQAVIWKYTTKYIVNSAVLSLVAFTASMLLLGSSYLIVKSSPMAKNAGFLGCCLFLIYPFAVFLFEPIMPYSFTYLLLLSLPAIIIIILSLILWRKNTAA